MKLVRSFAALTMAFALVVVSPGTRAWAQVVQASGVAAPAGGVGAAAAAGRGAPSAALAAGPSSLTTVSALAAPAAALSAPAASASARSLAAPAIPAASASAFAPAAASAETSAGAAAPGLAAPSPAAVAAPAAASPSAAASAPAAAPRAAAAPLAATAAALSSAREDGARAGALNALFSGDGRSRAAADGAARPLSAAAADSGLRPSGVLFAERADVPAPPRPILRTIAGPALGAGLAMWIAASAAPMLGIAGLGAKLLFIGASPLLAFVSLVLHEIAHARVAARLGDEIATRYGRASLNPLTWGRHLNLDWSLSNPTPMRILPVDFGAAIFRDAARGRARLAAVALAGPAVNAALAVAGALAYAGAAAAGLGAPILAGLAAFVFINATLTLLNLAPIPPLDGGHVLKALLPRSAAARVDAASARLGAYRMVPVALVLFLGGGLILGAAAALTQLLIGLSVAAVGVQLASAALPAAAALGLAMGSLGPSSGVPGAPPAASAPQPGTASFVVVFDRSAARGITKDVHLMQLDARRPDYAQSYQAAYGALMADVSALGVAPETLASYNASPVASYRRINAATFTLDAAKAQEFAAMLRAQGHKVYPNERRRIITPVPFQPESADPAARAAVTMEENLKITRADSVQTLAAARWGAPDLSTNASPRVSFLRRLLSGDAPAQPKVGVVDSGADTAHPLLKRVKQVLNFTTDPNVDDIGHGSWVTSMVLNYAPWLRNLTHYKTFTNGGATLDDILMALTAAANDGNLVISNSWGSDDGDPESPDSKLVLQLAQEGHIMVFAAGNAGPGANTVGSPAIVQFKDPATGAIRVIAVAATDRGMKVTGFSSVGPGSPKTQGQTGLAHRPDAASVGAQTEGAWPAALTDADRTDPDKGPLKAISGTSM